MRPWAARMIVHLYPKPWQRRYGAEFRALLEGQPISVWKFVQIIGWAFYERVLAVKDVRGALADIRGDVTYVLRSWRRAPVFALTLVVTVALGVATTAGIFSFADGFLFRPLPFPDAEQLFLVRDPDARPSALRASDVVALKQSGLRDFGFAEWSIRGGMSGDVIVGGQAIGALVYEVSPGFRATVALPLLAGRDFSSADHAADEPVPAWLAYRFWTREFDSDRQMLGQRLSIRRSTGAAEVVIVGILGPEVASFDLNNPPPDIVVPAVPVTDPGPNEFAFPMVRLPEGMSREQAEALIGSVLQTVAPGPGGTRNVQLRALREVQVAGGRPTARIFLLSALLVLLMCLINLTYLLITRSVARAAEVATRAALGASRSRIARLFLVEAALIATAGVVAGLLAGSALSGVIASRVPPLPTGPRNLSLVPVLFDGRVIGIGSVLGAVVVLAATAVPLWQATRLPFAQAIRGARTIGTLPKRASRVLLASELAVATVILISTLFIGSGIWRYLHQPLGFDVTDRYRVSITPGATEPLSALHMEQAADVLRRQPGVTAVGPFDLARAGELQIPGRSQTSEQLTASVATAGYREVWNVPVVAGRWFDSMEFRDSSPVAVVDSTFAAAAWPGSEPIGLELTVNDVSHRVVGVVAPRRSRLSAEPAGVAFVPGPHLEGGSLAVWAPRAAIPAVEAALSGSLPTIVPRAEIRLSPVTLASLFSRDIGEARFQAPVVAILGGLALLLAGVGVFGLVTFLIEQRRREIAIRLALGGQSVHVWRRLVVENAVIGTFGLGVGVACVGWVEPFLRANLFVPESSGVTAVVVSACALLVVVIAAAAIPAARATRVDPAAILRAE